MSTDSLISSNHDHDPSVYSMSPALSSISLQSALSPYAVSTPATPAPNTPRSPRSPTLETSSSWDFMDDMPMRWATDFKPLFNPNSRVNGSVTGYVLWRGSDAKAPVKLAVSTRTNILLFETPPNERAFKFVKVWQPRLAFKQSINEFTLCLGILYSGISQIRELCIPERSSPGTS